MAASPSCDFESGQIANVISLYHLIWRGPRETAPDPTAAVGDGDALADAREVLDLFTRLDPEDRERVLDLARRLAGE